MHRSISGQTTTIFGRKGAKQGFAQCSRFNRLTPSFMTGINILKQKTSRLTAFVFSLMLYRESCSCLGCVCNADRACRYLHTWANNICLCLFFVLDMQIPAQQKPCGAANYLALLTDKSVPDGNVSIAFLQNIKHLLET